MLLTIPIVCSPFCVSERQPLTGPIFTCDGHLVGNLVIVTITHNSPVHHQLHLKQRGIGECGHHIAQFIKRPSHADQDRSSLPIWSNQERGIPNWRQVAPTSFAPKATIIAPVTALTEHHGFSILLPGFILVPVSDGEIDRVVLSCPGVLLDRAVSNATFLTAIMSLCQLGATNSTPFRRVEHSFKHPGPSIRIRYTYNKAARSGDPDRLHEKTRRQRAPHLCRLERAREPWQKRGPGRIQVQVQKDQNDHEHQPNQTRRSHVLSLLALPWP